MRIKIVNITEKELKIQLHKYFLVILYKNDFVSHLIIITIFAVCNILLT